MKFLNKVCFVNSDAFINKSNKSPYVYIYSIEKDEIKYIDRKGNYNFFYSKAWTYKTDIWLK